MNREKLKKNAILHEIGICINKLYLNNILRFIDAVVILLRRLGCNGEYTFWKEYKEKYKGKRCFIVATGPSLTEKDLKKLDNEYTFAMNSIIKYIHSTNWKPTFYGIQDENVYETFESDILNTDIGTILISSNISKRYPIPRSAKVFPLCLLGQRYTVPGQKLFTKFSNDISICVYAGYSITYSLIQIAAYMGFSEIFLLGADCDFSRDKKHFIDYESKEKFFYTAFDRNIYSYQVAKKYADENGIKIYNATRGGKLEVFTRVDLDDVVSDLNLTGDVSND